MWFLTVFYSVNWPIVNSKHDDLVQNFSDRNTRDKCNYALTYNYDTAGGAIASVTVSAGTANCAARIPVTFPGPVKSQGTATAEQIGSDPLTLWVKLVGSAQTFELTTPVPL